MARARLRKRHRLRLPDGTKVKNEEGYQEFILNVLLENRPYTPQELGIALEKTPRQVLRYLKPLSDSGRIIKIPNSHFYKKASSRTDKATALLKKDIETKPEFYRTKAVKEFQENMTAKHKKMVLGWAYRICTGKTFKGFRIHPDEWNGLDTARTIRDLYYEKNGRQKLSHYQKGYLRTWLANAYGFSLEENATKLRKMGIDGDKDKAKRASLHIDDAVYQKIKRILKKEDYTRYLKFGFSHGTFCRPSSRYIVRLDQLAFYYRTIQYVQVNGEMISNKNVVLALQDKYKVTQYTHRAAAVNQFLEYKTDDSFQKFIFDEEVARDLEEYVNQRRKDGYKYLFWDDNSTVFEFENYDAVVKNEVVKDLRVFQDAFRRVGLKPDSPKFDANYWIRHFGVQKWLQQTNYNYGLIAKMGWREINTLIDFYGQRTPEFFAKEVGDIIW